MFYDFIFINISLPVWVGIVSGLVLGFGLIYLLCRSSDVTLENIFARLYHVYESIPEGLDPDSNKSMILANPIAQPVRYTLSSGYLRVNDNSSLIDSTGRVVDVQNTRSREAVVLFHGIGNTPNHLKSLFNFLVGMNKYDVYSSLLAGHGRTIQDLESIDTVKILDLIKYDVDYLLTRGYEKVYCIGHSFGGLNLARASIANSWLDNREKVKIILYAPSVITTVNAFQKNFLLKPLVNFKKYLTFKFETDYSVRPEYNKGFADSLFYPWIRKTTLTLLENAEVVNQLLRTGSLLNNDFALLYMKDDTTIPYDQLGSLFSRQASNNLRYSTLLQSGGHHPHLHTDPNIRSAFYTEVANAIDRLSMF